MHTSKRVVQWDAGANVERAAPIVIARNLSPIVATRVQDNMPALMALPVVWDLMNPKTEADADKTTTKDDTAPVAVGLETGASDTQS